MQSHRRFVPLALVALVALPLGATLCPSERLGLLLVSAYTSREQTRRPQRRKAANPGEISGDREA
jgi:hypothetical protein